MIFLIMLLANVIYGKDFLIKTGKGKYLVRGFRNRKNTENLATIGFDYEEPAWPNICSLKKEGPMNQTDVPGCGARIELKCVGGCLRILKVLYSCEEKNQSIPEQLAKVKARCEKKESCSVSASRTMFGKSECPNTPDDDMTMWITYSCDGGKDKTKLTGKRACLKKGKSPGRFRHNT